MDSLALLNGISPSGRTSSEYSCGKPEDPNWIYSFLHVVGLDPVMPSFLSVLLFVSGPDAIRGSESLFYKAMIR